MTGLLNQIDQFLSSRGARFWFWACTLTLMFIFGLMHHISVMGWPSPTTKFGVVDPDVWLRLTKVRELILDGNLHNHVVQASNAPYGGMETPWTRPVDFILVLLYQFTPSDFSIEKRLLLAANWYPLIIEAFILFFILKAAETGFKSIQKIGIVAVYVIGSLINSKTHNYFMVGNADHHSLQSLLWVISIWLLISKPSLRKSAILGATMGTWFWISPEALPFIFMIFIILGIKSILNAALVTHAIIVALSVTLTTILALFIEYPASEILIRPHYDNVSIIYAVFFSFCAAGFILLKPITTYQSDVKKRFALAGTAAATLAGLFLTIYPDFIKGPMANVEPYILTHFLPNIWEATPILKSGISVSLTILYLPIAALLLAIRFWKKEPVLLTLLFVPFVMVFFQVKWSFYLEAIAIIAMAKLLPTYIIALRRKYKIRAAALQPCYPVIVLHVIVFYALILLPQSNLTWPQHIADCSATAFQAIQSGDLVRALGDKPLIMESNILGNSGIPFFTPYHYVSGFYHREGVGMEIKDKIIGSPSLESVRPLLKERGIKALLICPSPIKDAWVNHYFDGNSLPKSAKSAKSDWVNKNDNLKLSTQTTYTTKPLLLMVNP